MDVAEIEQRMSNLDALYEPVAKRPVDASDREAMANLGATIAADIERLGVDDRAQAVLRAIVETYADGDESVREAIRRMFDRYTSFRWAAHLPREWDTAEEFRAHLILMSAHDQGADTRDEILRLGDLMDRASRAGIDVDPIMNEVAAMSSDVNRYGMGSMRGLLSR
jgi:hypothetical protein